MFKVTQFLRRSCGGGEVESPEFASYDEAYNWASQNVFFGDELFIIYHMENGRWNHYDEFFGEEIGRA